MSWKESIANNEKLKAERTRGIREVLLGKEAADEMDGDYEDKEPGLTTTHQKGGMGKPEDDDEDDDKDGWQAYRKAAAREDDDLADEELQEKPAAKAKEKPEPKAEADEEIKETAYTKHLREQNAELRAEMERDRLERQQVLEEIRRTAATAAPAPANTEADPALPWVEPQQLERFKQEQNQQGQAVTRMLIRQERAAYDAAVARFKESHPDFETFVPKSNVENCFAGFSQNPAKFSSDKTPGGFGQPWDDVVASAYYQNEGPARDAERLAAKRKEAKVVEKKNERNVQAERDRAKIPRSGSAYQEPAPRQPEPGRRDFKSIRGPVIDFLTSGG